MNVATLLDAQAAQHPGAAAIVETRGSGLTTSFGQLADRAARGAALLHSHGVRPGDAVLIVHSMQTALYVAIAAIFRLGAIAMFIDPSADPHIIGRCCELQRPVAFFSSGLGQLLRVRWPAIRSIRLNFSTSAFPGAIAWDRSLSMAPHEDCFIAGRQTPALLTFTSGSTGEPKAAVRSHHVLRAQLAALRETMGLAPGDRDLTTLPIVLLANLACGATSIISAVDLRRPGRVDAARVCADAIAQRASSSTASPAFFERVLTYCERTSLRLPEVRKLFCGGAPVFPTLLERLPAIAPQADPCTVYGSTEAEPIAHINLSQVSAADREAMRGGAGLLAGAPVAAVRMRVIGDRWGTPIPALTASEFEKMTAPPRDPGEIVVTGEHVLPGYLGGRGDEETKFKVDSAIWHRTGDLGYTDEQGRLWLLGRSGARIDDDRGTLYPLSLECAASFVAGVERCAVVAVGGQRVLAVAAAGVDRAALERALRTVLAWAHIDRFCFLPRLPVDRRHNAKVDYAALRKMLA